MPKHVATDIHVKMKGTVANAAQEQLGKKGRIPLALLLVIKGFDIIISCFGHIGVILSQLNKNISLNTCQLLL